MARRNALFVFRTEGIDSAIKKMRILPERNRRHVMRPAISAGATPVVKAAKRFAPKGAGLKPSGVPRTPLNRTMKKTSVKWYRSSDTFASTVGPEKNKAPHSHLVHNGTKPHLITLKKPLALRGVVLPPGFVIRHPGAKANPFLTNAVNATRKISQGIIRDKILSGIEKQVKKLRRSK